MYVVDASSFDNSIPFFSVSASQVFNLLTVQALINLTTIFKDNCSHDGFSAYYKMGHHL